MYKNRNISNLTIYSNHLKMYKPLTMCQNLVKEDVHPLSRRMTCLVSFSFETGTTSRITCKHCDTFCSDHVQLCLISEGVKLNPKQICLLSTLLRIVKALYEVIDLYLF